MFYSDNYVVKGLSETVTKSGIVAARIRAGAAGNVRLVAPSPATREEQAAVHTEERLRSLFDERGYLEVGDWSKPLFASILASTGGMRDAVNEALRTGRSGSLSSGLHHAGRDYGTGFCTINGLALAAVEALRKVNRVGILDLDAHFGGGTADILRDNDRVALADVGVNGFDAWEPTDTWRHFVARVRTPDRYLQAVKSSLKVLEDAELLIYNAGMDTHENAGGLEGVSTEIIQEREALVVEWARKRGVPVLFALAGGYRWDGLTLEDVAELHLITVRAFAA